jgi:hypothetical protein
MASLCMPCQYANEMSSSETEDVPTRDLSAGSTPPLEDPSPAQQQLAAADIVELWGYDSFPASDPPANW